MSEAQQRPRRRRPSGRRNRAAAPALPRQAPAGCPRPRSRAGRRSSRRSATRRSCRSAPAATTSPPRSGTTRSSSSPGRPGSGKTTQLPKICLELGRGVRGLIGHTQPRRIAARSVAERIAEELGVELGGAVGYQVRFTDRAGPDTLVKLMTDGILLAELQHDRMLQRLRHAHHRRGPRAQPQHRLHPRLPQAAAAAAARPQGRHHLGDHRPRAVRRALRRPRTGGRRRSSRSPAAPTRSRSATGRWSRSSTTTRRASRSSATRPRRSSPPARSWSPRGRATSWCSCPASGRSATPPTCSTGVTWGRDGVGRRAAVRPAVRPPSSTGSSSATSRRRIVLATNVAETSLTVPGIRYVVDTGVARISRYSYRDQGAAAADRADQPGLGQPALGALRPGRGRASRSGSTRRRTSTAGRSSPTRRSCAPTSPR